MTSKADLPKLYLHIAQMIQQHATPQSTSDMTKKSGASLKVEDHGLNLIMDFSDFNNKLIEVPFSRLESKHHFFDDVRGLIAKFQFSDSDEFIKASEESLKQDFLAAYQKIFNKPYDRPINLDKIFADSHGYKNNKLYVALSLKSQELANDYLRVKTFQKNLNLYRQLFIFCKVVADLVGENSDAHDSLAYAHAYKMLILFGGKNLVETVKNFDQYRHKYLQDSSDGGFVVLNNIRLPSDGGSITLDTWREFIKLHGTKAINMFSLADVIEKKKFAMYEQDDAKENEQFMANNMDDMGSKQRDIVASGHLAPNNLEDAEKTKVFLVYKRANEDRSFARVCLQYQVPEEVFNRYLDLSKKIVLKKKDNLPNLVVDGSKIGKKGYWLVKMPINDYRAYILGQIVNTCQYVGGDSEQCVIDGLTKENNGFYVLLHETSSGNQERANLLVNGKIDYSRYEIVGQAYTWLSRAGNLVFDSWDNLRPETDDTLTSEILKDFACEVTEKPNSKISRAMIGEVGKVSRFFEKAFPDYAIDSYQYGDSSVQNIVYESKRLLRVREEIKKIFPGIFVEQIISFELADEFLNFVRDDHNHDLVNELARRVGDLPRVAIILCQYGGDKLANLVPSLLEEKDEEKLRALFSDDADEAYRSATTVKELQRMTLDKIKALISYGAVDAYLAGATFQELKHLYENKRELFNMLTSKAMSPVYVMGAVFQDLQYLYEKDHDRFIKLTDHNVWRVFQFGCKFQSLMSLDDKELEALTSDMAIEAYGAGATYKYLKYLYENDLIRFTALTSYDVDDAYQFGFKFADLKDLGVKEIKDLTTHEVVMAHVAGATFEELKSLYEDPKKRDEFYDLTSYGAAAIYEEGFEEGEDPEDYRRKAAGKFLALKELYESGDMEKFEALTSDEAMEAYREGDVKFEDLEDLSVDEINIKIYRSSRSYDM
ncbi:MAG: hypothetical protein KKE11_02180 [Gammaproteobacteria bacterium]|nr:hypothetical protein [Gammaproteobacteria bacterium]